MGKNSKRNTGVKISELRKITADSSKFITVTESHNYIPQAKEPSRRDLHRMSSGYTKYNQ